MNSENSDKIFQPDEKLREKFLDFINSGPHELQPAQQAALRAMGFKNPIADRPVAPSTKTLPRLSRAQLGIPNTEFDDIATLGHRLFDDDETIIAAPKSEASQMSSVPSYLASTVEFELPLSSRDTLPPWPRTAFSPPRPPTLAVPKLLLEKPTRELAIFDRRTAGTAAVSALATMGILLTGLAIRDLLWPQPSNTALTCPPPIACPAPEATAAPLCSTGATLDRPVTFPPRGTYRTSTSKKVSKAYSKSHAKVLRTDKPASLHRHRPKKSRRLPFLEGVAITTSTIRTPVVMIMAEYRLKTDSREELDRVARECGLNSANAILGISPNKEIFARLRDAGEGPFRAGSSWRVPCHNNKFAAAHSALGIKYLFPYSTSAY